MTKENNQPEKDGVDFLDILKTIWSSRKFIFAVTSLFVVLGIAYALIAPSSYRVVTTMIPQTNDGSGGKLTQGLGGLASLAGINLGNNPTDGIPPALYPEIIRAVPFQLEMLNTSLTTPKADAPITFKEYQTTYGDKSNVLGIIKKYTIGLPSTISRSLRSKESREKLIEDTDSLFRISLEEKELMESLESILNLHVNELDGIITLSVVMPEGVAAAQMATNAQVLLQKAVTDFRIKKVKEQLEFTEKLYEERKADFISCQNALAKFRDQHLNLSTAVAMNKLERLESDYFLAQSIYTDIAQQLESMKIKLKENTPSFVVLQPVVVPIDRHKPKKKTIVLTSFFLGIVIGIGGIFVKQQYILLKDAWTD